MIEINSSEARHLRQVLPDAHIRKTTHKIYAEESLAVLKALPDNMSAQSALAELNKVR